MLIIRGVTEEQTTTERDTTLMAVWHLLPWLKDARVVCPQAAGQKKKASVSSDLVEAVVTCVFRLALVAAAPPDRRSPFWRTILRCHRHKDDENDDDEEEYEDEDSTQNDGDDDDFAFFIDDNDPRTLNARIAVRVLDLCNDELASLPPLPALLEVRESDDGRTEHVIDLVNRWVRLVPAADHRQLLNDSLRLLVDKARCGHNTAIVPILKLCQAVTCT
jgi:hypothetical protein